MTIISTIISRNYTVHSSDSLITRTNRDGIREPIEWKKSKIVKVESFRGAMSYWGLALYKTHSYELSMYEWLNDRARRAHQYKSPAEFAEKLADNLNEELSNLKFAKQVDGGIGIHFTAYENINNYWIPEFFLISNWESVDYRQLRPNGVGVSRETYYVDPERDPNQNIGEPDFRMKVHSFLRNNGLLIYNNGDPLMFNPVANGISLALRQLSDRRILKHIDIRESLIALAQRPIDVVSAIQRDFCEEGTRLVGGRIHNLAINGTTGEYYSTSGD
jgi:hypothetical protein